MEGGGCTQGQRPLIATPTPTPAQPQPTPQHKSNTHTHTLASVCASATPSNCGDIFQKKSKPTVYHTHTRYERQHGEALGTIRSQGKGEEGACVQAGRQGMKEGRGAHCWRLLPSLPLPPPTTRHPFCSSQTRCRWVKERERESERHMLCSAVSLSFA